MTDRIEEVVPPATVERAMEVIEQIEPRCHPEPVQARKALTEHIFGLVASGETDGQQLVVAGLAHLNALETQSKANER
jgi:hypothetical protein